MTRWVRDCEMTDICETFLNVFLLGQKLPKDVLLQTEQYVFKENLVFSYF